MGRIYRSYDDWKLSNPHDDKIDNEEEMEEAKYWAKEAKEEEKRINRAIKSRKKRHNKSPRHKSK